MNPNTTLTEITELCNQLTEKYGEEESCEYCEFADHCKSFPASWGFDEDTPPVPNPDDGRMTVRKLMAFLSLCNPEFTVVFEDNIFVESVMEHRDITNPDRSRVILY